VKKLIFCIATFWSIQGFTQYVSTPPVLNNNISASEYGGSNNTWNDGTRDWYIAWDANNLYLATSDNGNPANDEFVIYIDTDPTFPANGGTGNIDGIGNFDGVNYGRLPFSANFCAFVRNTYHQHRTSSGTWSAASNDDAAILTTSNPNKQEIQIAWSLLGGKPNSFNFFIYINGGTPYGGNSRYNASGDNDQSNNLLNLTGRRYFNVASTLNVASPGPFSRLCYTNPRPGYNTINDYGSAYYDITMNTGVASTNTSLSAATTADGSVYIGSQDVFDMNANTLAIKGNISRQQPLGALIDMGLVSFTGTTDQTQTGNITYLAGATINKTAGKFILTSNGSNDGMVIDNNSTLTLTQGKVDARTNNSLVEIKSGSSVSSGNANSYINGTLQINNITSAKTFPVGNSGFNPATLLNSGTADNFNINVGDYLTSDGTATGIQGTYGVVNRTWNVNESVAGGSNVTLTLQWNAAEELSFNNTSCYVGHFTAGNWQPTTAAAATGAGGAGPFTRSRNNITSFSPFGLASIGALPLQLISLNATAQRNGNVIQWQTASELNHKGYYIQRSTDGINFSSIQFVPSALQRNGNYYEYNGLDINHAEPKIYYRLQLVELTGVVSYSKIIVILSKTETTFTVWNGSGTHTFQIKTVLQNKATLSLINATGLLLNRQNIQKGSTVLESDFSKYPAGLYFLILKPDGENIQTRKIILQ
jgi:hypothetical protein